MNIEETYQEVLEEIEKGHRALRKFSQEELSELDGAMLTSLDQNDFGKLGKVLCLVEHSASFHGKFEKVLIKILTSEVPDQIMIFALNSSRKHIVEARFQKGVRLEFGFLESLKRLLYSKSPEVVEWTLRVIEGTGNQGVYFLREFDKIKPPPWKWFNPHQRAVREIIALLENRWSPLERTKR